MAELFNITHNDVTLDEYNATVTDGGDLSAETPGLAGTPARMEAFLDDEVSIYGQKNFSATDVFRFRFYLHPNSLTQVDAADYVLVAHVRTSSDTVCRVYLVGDPADYAIEVYYWTDTLTWQPLTFKAITDAQHYVEVHVVAGDGTGTIEFWVDGASIDSDINLDTDTQWANIDNIRFGAEEVVDSSGTFYCDELKANDDGGQIGPVSPSPSPSASTSASASASASASPSATLSPSSSPSASESASASASSSASASPSPSPGIGATVCWGHITGVLEDNIRTFAGNWAGTGAIENAGDAERLKLQSGESMQSEMVDTGTQTVQLLQNEYDITGDDVTMKYRHGATPNACAAAGWVAYVAPFDSLGYVEILMEATI